MAAAAAALLSLSTNRGSKGGLLRGFFCKSGRVCVCACLINQGKKGSSCATSFTRQNKEACNKNDIVAARGNSHSTVHAHQHVARIGNTRSSLPPQQRLQHTHSALGTRAIVLQSLVDALRVKHMATLQRYPSRVLVGHGVHAA
jgi:hypothetical protein